MGIVLTSELLKNLPEGTLVSTKENEAAGYPAWKIAKVTPIEFIKHHIGHHIGKNFRWPDKFGLTVELERELPTGTKLRFNDERVRYSKRATGWVAGLPGGGTFALDTGPQWAPLKHHTIYKVTEIVLPGTAIEDTVAKAVPDVDRPKVRDWYCNCWISRSKTYNNGTDVPTLQHAVRCRSLYAENIKEDGKSGMPVSCLGNIAPLSKPANYVELEWLDELVCADTE